MRIPTRLDYKQFHPNHTSTTDPHFSPLPFLVSPLPHSSKALDVTARHKDTHTEMGEEHIEGNLRYLGWILFLIGILSVSWYLWKNITRRNTIIPTPLETMYGYERIYQ